MVTQDTKVRTFWLSFCDGHQPKGQQFLGVAIVDITPEDIAEAEIITALRFPDATEDGPIIGAAVRKAHQTGCNPGGEVASIEITSGPSEELDKLPRHTLLSKDDLRALGQIE